MHERGGDYVRVKTHNKLMLSLSIHNVYSFLYTNFLRSSWGLIQSAIILFFTIPARPFLQHHLLSLHLGGFNVPCAMDFGIIPLFGNRLGAVPEWLMAWCSRGLFTPGHTARLHTNLVNTVNMSGSIKQVYEVRMQLYRFLYYDC